MPRLSGNRLILLELPQRAFVIGEVCRVQHLKSGVVLAVECGPEFVLGGTVIVPVKGKMHPVEVTELLSKRTRTSDSAA